MKAVQRTLEAFRDDPLSRTFAVKSVAPLGDPQLRFAVRLYPDAPTRLVEATASVISTSMLNGLHVTLLRFTVPKSAIQALPKAREPGADAFLAYDVQMLVDGVETTVLFGDLIVRGSANG